jgi:hypothetical protein
VLRFGSADSKGVTGVFCGSADSTRLRRQKRSARGKKNGTGRNDVVPEDRTSGVLQKSAEVIEGKRVVETLFLEEWGRI